MTTSLRIFCSAVLLALASMTSMFAQASRDDVALDTAGASHLLGLLPVPSQRAPTAGDLENRVVVVTFFASWCPPCREEFQHLREIVTQFEGQPVTVVGVNIFEAWDENDGPRMAKFLAHTKPNFPLVTGTRETRARFGNIDRIPTLFVFDRSGRQAWRFVHVRNAKKMTASKEELQTAITSALAAVRE